MVTGNRKTHEALIEVLREHGLRELSPGVFSKYSPSRSLTVSLDLGRVSFDYEEHPQSEGWYATDFLVSRMAASRLRRLLMGHPI